MDSIEIEALEDKNYKLGIISGLNMASNILLELAVSSFKANKDEFANRLKEISKYISEVSENKRKEYDKCYLKS